MQTPATIALLLITTLATLYAFWRPEMMERWCFDPEAVLARKEYYRVVTCGLIHLDWMHFAFNIYSFYCFARSIEMVYGAAPLLMIYGASIIGGSLLSLLVHRHHPYRALGASGGVCGIIFASIFLLPGTGVTAFPLPVALPGCVYAPIFLVASFLAFRRRADSIGHDAHLGGAMVGLLAAAAMYPRLIEAAPRTFAAVLVLSLTILLLLMRDPLHLVKLPFGGETEPAGGERMRRYQENNQRNQKLARMDALLDKVACDGLDRLSSSERKQLAELSKELYPNRQSGR